MAPADVEWVLGVVRAGRDYQGMESAKAGGPGYDFTATIIVRGKTAEIVGGAGRITPILAREIEVALYEQGITTAVWERFSGDPRRIVRATRGRSPDRSEGERDAPHMEQDSRRQEADALPDAIAEAQAIRSHHPALQAVEPLGLAAARFGLGGGLAHDHTGVRTHGHAGPKTPQATAVVRQKAVSR